MEDKKTCKKCNVEKPLIDMVKNKANKDGYASICKICQTIHKKVYYIANCEIKKEKSKIHREKNKKYYDDYNEKYYIEHMDKLKENAQINRENNREYNRQYAIEYRKKNPESAKNYYRNNIEREKLRCKENNKKNRIKNNLKIKERKNTDKLFNIKLMIRDITRKAIKNCGYTKKSKTYEILDCSYEFLLKHIEEQWLLPHNLDVNGNVWMTWQNHGKYKSKTLNHGWDVDHIIPLASAKTEEELLNLCHYTNLQPLCSRINRYIKKDRLNWDKNNPLK